MNVRKLLKNVIKGGIDWQGYDINGVREQKRHFNLINISILAFAILALFKFDKGISKDILGYIMSAFSISVSLFMSLLVSIFDKFEKTDFTTSNKSSNTIARLKQKKNFFKRFISITSYLVLYSIIIIILCSLSYMFGIHNISINLLEVELANNFHEVDWYITIKFGLVILYRTIIVFCLLKYLYLTLFITASAYDFYISELNEKKID